MCGHDSQIADWGSHSAGMRKPRLAGVGSVETGARRARDDEEGMEAGDGERLVDEPLGQIAVGVDPAVPQERPVGAGDVNFAQVDVG